MRTGVLELNSERGEEIIEAISSHHRDEASCMRVTVMPVSTYVSQPKEEYASSAWVPPKQPPFASHWGIVVGDIDQRGKAWLFHLMLREDGKEREVVFVLQTSIGTVRGLREQLLKRSEKQGLRYNNSET